MKIFRSLWFTLQFSLIACCTFILLTGAWMIMVSGAPWIVLPWLLTFTAVLSIPGQFIFWMLLCFMPLNQPVQKKLLIIRIFLFAFVVLCVLSLSLIHVPFLHAFPGYGYNTFFQSVLVFSFLGMSCWLALRIMERKYIRFFQEVQGIPTEESTTSELLHSITHKINSTMETSPIQPPASAQGSILIKGLTTGGLILLLLIPTIFITHLIEEREKRHQEVVQEVSARWANPQTIASPYIIVPYTETFLNHEGKPVQHTQPLVLFSKHLTVQGEVFPETRARSIYTILLYRSHLQLSGTFKPQWPSDIKKEQLQLDQARICFGIGDYKGVEKEIRIRFGQQSIELSPGVPAEVFKQPGLSAPVPLTIEQLEEGINFDMDVSLKGSGKLHFLPISSNSSFQLKSNWHSPSFDGNNLPNQRKVDATGFTASWNFNQANLPFAAVSKSDQIQTEGTAFGVSLVQPADHYDKALRSVKYAILIIGLTFAVFFIMELVSKKPFHPVQYVLVGMALVIFYSLLLSVSEYIIFDYAYLISAIATISMVVLYAKSHFGNWKAAFVFSATLSILYGFIFVLLRLEDTALLVGSIGLFIVLACIMYVSRKINWYGRG
ncbi:MAG TPA: cell envelope integrity protein CreD [Ferruginibacter sp.]|nr:cell envelope integrity protein CreD [Ferruginibacter sp.]HRO16613.1 cell envelope integrity protein CreD [Ferruginibacter sp.]HRQ20769.1 cell envelope integrity protein CreD [Ferruginibacter sp.]